MATAVKTVETKNAFEEKLKALEKKFGVGTIISGKDTKEELEVVPSGSLGIDIASSIGGIPVGKLIEVMGMESSGKSTFSLHAISNFQKLKGRCVLIDFEQSFDRTYAEALGVSMDNLLICQPACQEDGYNLAEELIKTGEVRLIVIDSHTAAMPKKVVDGEVGESSIGLQARINSTGLGKIKPLLRENRCTLLAISQLRVVIGAYGDPNQATGGLSYKFYSDMRFKFTKSVDKDAQSNKTTVEIIKNKCGVPFGKAMFSINWGKGVDRQQEIIDLAVELKLISRAGGGWYTVAEGVKLQGDNALKQFLLDNPAYAEEIEAKVLEGIKNN